MQIGNDNLATTVTAQGLSNTGRIDIDGGTNQAELDIAAAAPATWAGTVNVSGNGLLEFAGTGGIGAIASGAQINLFGPQAFIAAAGLGTTGDTALTGLASNSGQLVLQDGAALTTTVGLTNSGALYVDHGGSGGSSLTIGGTLTNSGSITIGNNSLSASSTVTASGLANTGTINLQGNNTTGTTRQATLGIVSGTAPAILTGGLINLGGDALLEAR